MTFTNKKLERSIVHCRQYHTAQFSSVWHYALTSSSV